MNRLAVLVVAACALLVPASVLADSTQYNDPAMSFTPPDGYVRLQIPPHDPATFDDPAVMAAYVRDGGKADASQIMLKMQNFEGDVTAFDTTVENDMRNQGSDVFIKKTPTKLSNGMPAIWQEITLGSGFDQVKIYQYIWADGVRGVELSITGRNGAVDPAKAQSALANVSAVAYPRYRY